MVGYEIEFWYTDKKMGWERYRSERFQPFTLREDAEEFKKSAEVYAAMHNLRWVFRVVEVPLPWGRQ